MGIASSYSSSATACKITTACNHRIIKADNACLHTIIGFLLSVRLRSSRAPHIEHIDCVAIGKVLGTNMRDGVGIASILASFRGALAKV
jgi:hypothetical protein